MNDIPSELDAVTGFVREAQKPCENIDLTLGSSGVLLGCALLTEALQEYPAIRGLGDALLKEIWERIESMPAIAEEKHFRFTGIAHGWAGVLYAVLMWCRATGSKPPGSLMDRLHQLADLGEPNGNGVQWERKVRGVHFRDANDFSPSWCNGTGGMVHLWTLAHRMMDDGRFLEMAEGAAWNVIERCGGIDQICCGVPGQTYGVLNLYKHTGEKRWLDHARKMAETSLRLTTPQTAEKVPLYYYGLYKGPIGSALLSADMAAPEEACMPMFESEGWSARTEA
jgi:serine/threonine-protein kinase